jgi:hypothetical protein
VQARPHVLIRCRFIASCHVEFNAFFFQEPPFLCREADGILGTCRTEDDTLSCEVPLVNILSIMLVLE